MKCCCCCCCVASVMSDSVGPHRWQPTRLPVPGILQARTLERVAISFSNARKWKVKVKSLSRVWLFEIPWTAAYQALPSMGFSRQKYWSGVPLSSPWSASLTESLTCKIFESNEILLYVIKVWVGWFVAVDYLHMHGLHQWVKNDSILKNVSFSINIHIPTALQMQMQKKKWIWLKKLYLYSALEKAMEPHSSTLAWKIPWMEEPGRL